MVEHKKKRKKDSEKEEKRKVVYVDINDILEAAKELIMATNGGIDNGSIRYESKVDKLKFSIPETDRKGKCQEILSPTEEGACGETGGSCICGKDKDHDDDHECELCGESW